jgi:hypothetical protein
MPSRTNRGPGCVWLRVTPATRGRNRSRRCVARRQEDENAGWAGELNFAGVSSNHSCDSYPTVAVSNAGCTIDLIRVG